MLRWLLPSSASGWAVVVLAVALGLSMGKSRSLGERVAELEDDKAALTAALDVALRRQKSCADQTEKLQALLEEDRKFAAGREAIIMQARPVPPDAGKAEEEHGLDKASQARVLHHLDDSFDRLRR